MTETVCKQCQKKYKRIGNHWQKSTDCDYPEFSTRQKQIILGLMLGDGGLSFNGKNPQLEVVSTTKPFLGWLSKEFPATSTGVRMKHSSEYMHDSSIKRGEISPDSRNNRKNVWRLFFRSHPHFNEFRDWYDGEQYDHRTAKGNITITSLVAKIWYVGDGTLAMESADKPPARITFNEFSSSAEMFRDEFRRNGFEGELYKSLVEKWRNQFSLP